MKRFKYKKDGTLRFFKILCWLGINGHVPPIKFERGRDDKKFLHELKSTWKYGSLNHLVKYITCYMGFHRPYPGNVYGSCWVCGRIFKKNEPKQ